MDLEESRTLRPDEYFNLEAGGPRGEGPKARSGTLENPRKMQGTRKGLRLPLVFGQERSLKRVSGGGGRVDSRSEI